MLDGIESEGVATPGDAPRFPGVFTVVGDDGSARVRRLPGFYFGRAQLFAHRDRDAVVTALRRTVAGAVASRRTPTYLLHACEIDGRAGLYGRDPFNRAPFRASLQRLGMRFAPDNFVTFDESGVFNAADWGPFTPDFVIMGGWGADEAEVVVSEGALLLFTLTTFRLGPPTPAELHALAGLVGSIRAVASQRSEALVRAITGSTRSS